jgi:molybdopterin converting factor small subunit
MIVSLPEHATVADLVRHLSQTYPRASRLAAALPVVAGQYAAADHPLAAGVEVALLLPVAGGGR